jgi:nuclear polyadenylated RNA-binding protein NAB2
MAFGLTIGTDRATALQHAIQDELMGRGYSTDADPVMAEYITIMIINNKTAGQITSELEDLIGPDYDSSFTQWLFQEASKGSMEAEPLPELPPSEPSERPTEPALPRPTSNSTNDAPRRGSNPPRNGVYQQALSQALPSSSAQKRSASGRSPSPTHPNKMRRTDVPTGPRAMQRDGPGGGNTRSLLDRVGGPPVNGQDEIQARIDNIVNTGDPNMMMPAGFPGMAGMDMNAMAGMANPMMIQELMMNQMALMAHFSGMMNPAQFPGFPMQGQIPGPQDMGIMQQNVGMNGFQGQPNGSTRGRGSGRGRGVGRGRGGAPSSQAKIEEVSVEPPVSSAPSIVAPTPTVASANPAPASEAISPAAVPRPAYAVPERPQSPTLCKFGLKCTNPHCRWSHPSPVATLESGVVLSNDPCENGKNCKDKDCIKAHVSPATLKPHDTTAAPPATPHPQSFSPSSPVPCRFGAACTRPNCAFSHPPRPSNVSCRFGAGCTKATCQFQHPPGRVLPTTFHRGLSENGPMVTVKNPEPGSMGGPRPHRSATFNNSAADLKEKLKKQMKEIEEKKSQAEKAVREAQAKKDDAKPVVITA